MIGVQGGDQERGDNDLGRNIGVGGGDGLGDSLVANVLRSGAWLWTSSKLFEDSGARNTFGSNVMPGCPVAS